jgi:hypothetical protein
MTADIGSLIGQLLSGDVLLRMPGLRRRAASMPGGAAGAGSKTRRPQIRMKRARQSPPNGPCSTSASRQAAPPARGI